MPCGVRLPWHVGEFLRPQEHRDRHHRFHGWPARRARPGPAGGCRVDRPLDAGHRGDDLACSASLRLWRSQARTRFAAVGAVDLRNRRADRNVALRGRASGAAGAGAPRDDLHRRRGCGMSVQWIGAVGVLGLLALLFFRTPVWAALIIVGLAGNSVINGWSPAFTTLGTTPFDVANSYP